MAVTNQSFFDGLSDSGFRDGSTMKVVFRTADGDMSRMPALIDEVLKEKVDVLVVSTSPGCAAARKATTTVPVLCISVQDSPITEGLTTDLAHGNGNVVGVHSYLPDGIQQQLRMTRSLAPTASRIGILHNPKNATHIRLLGEWQRIAADAGMTTVPMPVTVAADLDNAIAGAKAARADIAIGLLGADTYAIRKEIARASSAHEFPIAMDTPGGYVELGGVATVGVDIVPLYRRGALELMVPMLRGVAPSRLPWLGPDKATMTVNDTVARQFGLTVP